MLDFKRVAYSRKTSVSMLFSILLIALTSSAQSEEQVSEQFDWSALVKIDVIYDLDAPSGDRINYSSIPVSSSAESKQSRIHARQSRIKVNYQNNSKQELLKAVVEGDFFGGGTNSPLGSENISNSSSFRIRHAFVEYGSWLVGQTWSNYVDVASYPETLDFSNDTGQAFLRQGQLRFQHRVNDFDFSYSLENPESDLVPNSNIVFTKADPLFDVTAKVKYKQDWGHISVQTVWRKIEANALGSQKSEVAYGVGSSGKVRFADNQLVKFHYSQGKGVGRYIQEASGAAGVVIKTSEHDLEGGFNLELVEAKGGYLAYQYSFSPTLRTNLSAGFVTINDASYRFEPLFSDNTKKLMSMHANVIWKWDSNIEVGIEHSYAEVSTVASRKGRVKRLQLSTIYKF